MKTSIIVFSKPDTYALDWHLFSVDPAAAPQTTGASETPPAITLQSHHEMAVASNDLQVPLFPPHHPAWSRLTDLTVTLYPQTGRVYVLKWQQRATDSGPIRSLEIYGDKKTAPSRGSNVFSWQGRAGALISESGLYKGNPPVDAFLADMKSEGLNGSNTVGESSMRPDLARIALQILDALELPENLPERFSEPSQAQNEYHSKLDQLSNALHEIKKQTEIWDLTTRSAGSDEIPMPVLATTPLQRQLIQDILRAHLTPQSLARVIAAFDLYFVRQYIVQFLEPFFNQEDVQAKIAAWNSDPRTRRFLMLEFLKRADPRHFDARWMFYSMKLLGLKTTSLADFMRDIKYHFDQVLDTEDRVQHKNGKWNQNIGDAVHHFYQEQMSRVIDPSLVAAFFSHPRQIERAVKMAADNVILKQATHQKNKLPFASREIAEA